MHRCAVAFAAIALGAFSLGMSMIWSVPAAQASGPANPEATELVRLINGERAHLGRAALRVDTFLAGKARDGAVACPNDPSLVVAGRAKDFALYGWGSNAHALRLCPNYTSMDAMRSWGYTGGRGETAALNGGYGTAKVTYAYGCSPSVRTCSGASTTSYSTTAHAMLNWTSSSSHYSIIIGAYDRVGCGAWIGANGAYYYDCMFSRGGRAATRSAPRTGSSGGGSTGGTTTAAGSSASPTDAVTQTPSPLATATLDSPLLDLGLGESQAASPSSDPAALANVLGGPQGNPPSNGHTGLPISSRSLGLATGAMAAMISILYGLALALRGRRARNQTVREG
jgi:hypothetical protein